MARVWAVVAAAGQSTRMGGVNKQMFFLEGVPVLIRSLYLLEQNSSVEGIILVVPSHQLLQYEEEINQWKIKKMVRVVPGGIHRQQSVYLGLLAVPFDCPLVLVHDGARPLVTAEEIQRLIEAVKDFGAATLAVPVKDTVKEVDSRGLVVNTPERGKLWLAQTPQGFDYGILIDAHRRAEEKKQVFTDDASMLEARGYPVKIVQGSYRNIKITTSEDLAIAGALLRQAADKPKREEVF